MLGKTVGVAGILIDGYQLYVGIAENGWQWNQDGWNAAQVGLGVIGLAGAVMFAAPWVAVATGVISIGIAVGTKICED